MMDGEGVLGVLTYQKNLNVAIRMQKDIKKSAYPYRWHSLVSILKGVDAMRQQT